MLPVHRSILIWLGVGVTAVLVLAFYGFWQYTMPHRQVSNETTVYKLAVDEIYREFQEDESKAFARYSDQVIELRGNFIGLEQGVQTQLVLLSGETGKASCLMAADITTELSQLEKGTEIRLNGLFVGYDDLLSEIQLRDCELAEGIMN